MYNQYVNIDCARAIMIDADVKLSNGFKYYYGGVFNQVKNLNEIIDMLNEGCIDKDKCVTNLVEVRQYLTSIADTAGLDESYYPVEVKRGC